MRLQSIFELKYLRTEKIRIESVAAQGINTLSSNEAQEVEGNIKKTSNLKRKFNDDLVRRWLQSIRGTNENRNPI